MVLEKLLLVLKELEVALRDAEKFDKGNASAGTRLRKQAQVVVRGLKDVRKVVSETRASRKSEKVQAKTTGV